MSTRTLTRRTLLKGLLGGAAVAIGLPPLERFMNSHGTAYAAGGVAANGFPKRFGLFFWGNGVIPERWLPTGVGHGADWELSEELAPLTLFKSQLTVVSGARVQVPNVEPHHATAAGILTGHPLLDDNGTWTVAAPTIDQIIAAELGQDSRFKSLEFGAEPGAGMSMNGPHSANPAESSPIALFERVFGGGFSLPGDDGAPDPTLALQRSILSAVSEDMAWVQGQVGYQDRIRLEQHLDGIRAIEKRLLKLEENPPSLAACAFPTTPEAEYPDIEGRPQLQPVNAALCDVLAMALACDQTRVFSNTFTRPLVNVLFDGATAGHHRLTHDEPGDQPQVNSIAIQCMEALAYQLGALQAVEEGDGTLLDSCLVFGTSDVSRGKTHSGDDFPLLLVGSGGGALKTDVHLASPADNASKILLTIAHAMDLQLAEIGSEEGFASVGFDELTI